MIEGSPDICEVGEEGKRTCVGSVIMETESGLVGRQNCKERGCSVAIVDALVLLGEGEGLGVEEG